MNSIKYNVISDPLNSLVNRTINKLEREIEEDASVLLKRLLQVAKNNFDAIEILVLNSFKYSSPAKIICRSNLDIVFSVCLICHNTKKYGDQYLRSGWRTSKEKYLRWTNSPYKDELGDKWLNEFNEYLELSATELKISDEDQENLKNVKYYPHASQIIMEKSEYFQALDQKTQYMLTFLMNEFYTELSEISHVTSPGLSIHYLPFVIDIMDDQKKKFYIDDSLFIGMMTLMCIISEINLKYKMNENAKLKEVWTYLASTVPIQDSLYKIKYKHVL